MGEGETVVLEVVFGLEVTGDGNLTRAILKEIPEDVAALTLRGAVNGEILAEEVVG